MKKKNISRIYFLFSVAISVGILSVLVYQVGFKQFSAIIMKTSPLLIAISILIYSISWFFRTLRLKYLTLQNGDNIKSFDLFKLNVAGFALNNILPAKLGDASMVGFLRMRGIDLGESAAIVIQMRVLDLLALIVLVILSITFISDTPLPFWVRKTIYFSMFVPIAIITAILDHFVKKAFTLGFGIPATFSMLGREWSKTFHLLKTGQ